MNKYVAAITFIVIAGLMVGIYVYGENQEPKWEWTKNCLGLAGTLLSLGGVVMALVQIKQASENIETVAQTTIRIQQAVADNRKEIRDFLSTSDVAHLIESIRHAQHHIRQKAYPSAVLLIQMIKDDLIRANSEFEPVLKQLHVDMLPLITKLNLDIQTLTLHGMYEGRELGDKLNLKPEVLHQNLEVARDILIKIESHLKQQKL